MQTSEPKSPSDNITCPSTFQSPICYGSRPTEPIKRPAKVSWGQRRQDHLNACREYLEAWRLKRWEETYSGCIWGPEIILPDKVLTKLATFRKIKEADDIQLAVPEWGWARKHGEEVFEGLRAIDEEVEREKEAKKEAARAERKREAEAKA
jgi:hypothetical protein